MTEIIMGRLDKIREAMAEKKIDALLVLVEENRRYLSGFTGEDHHFDESAGALLITAKEQILTTDSRFELQAVREAPLYEVTIYRNGLAKELVGLTDRFNIRRLGFESTRVSVQQHDSIQQEFAGAGRSVDMVPLETFVENLRQIKTPAEIQQTQKALELAEDVFRHVAKMLKPGMSEKNVAWEMEKGMRQAGADSLSFPVIIAAGPNSALPHAIPTEREINLGEPILFDWGAKLNGYCSDTSRTVTLGPPDEMFLKVYQTVLEAQQKAITVIQSGASSRAVDAIARDHIRQQGYEGKFGHGLGHGTGLAVHEAPRLSPLKEVTLESGMIVTVEPGVYLPEWGGIRIENQVVVGDRGAQVLNRLSTTYDIGKID
ncbi:MAG: aminopeptidase P family protein [Desulfobacteraceae bacterium]|nr:MAG: aminopeptidase P family protein [Desulfobacteraceae bacterium]